MDKKNKNHWEMYWESAKKYADRLVAWIKGLFGGKKAASKPLTPPPATATPDPVAAAPIVAAAAASPIDIPPVLPTTPPPAPPPKDPPSPSDDEEDDDPFRERRASQTKFAIWGFVIVVLVSIIIAWFKRPSDEIEVETSPWTFTSSIIMGAIIALAGIKFYNDRRKKKNPEFKGWWTERTEEYPNLKGLPTKALLIFVSILLLEGLLDRMGLVGWDAVRNHEAFFYLNVAVIFSSVALIAITDKAIKRFPYFLRLVALCAVLGIFVYEQWFDKGSPVGHADRNTIAKGEHSILQKGEVLRCEAGDIMAISAVPLYVRIDGKGKYKLYQPGTLDKPGPFAKIPKSAMVDIKSDQDIEVIKKVSTE